MNPVRLPRAIADRLRRLAQASPDEEICGLVARDSRGRYRCYPVPNVAADRRRFFALDPRTQIDAMRAMRERGEELAAIYHSHPDSPPLPSAADVEQHEYPGVLYLIVSLATGGAPELRGFHIRERRVEEVPLLMEDEPTC